MLRSATLVALLLASSALAQTVYRWVDEEGITNYTDVPATIPKGATVFATEGEPISEMGKPGPVPVLPAGSAAQPRPEEAGPAIPGSSEQYWSGQFRQARQKILALEDEQAADRRRAEELGGLPSTLGYTCSPWAWSGVVGPVWSGRYVFPSDGCMPILTPEYDRQDRTQRALERAREELHELELRASYEAVPLEWRR